MDQDSRHAGNVLLIRGAVLWLLAALVLAWCMVGMSLDISPVTLVFQGKFMRLLQAHLDFLLMSAMLFGFYAAKMPLPWHVRWAMVVGAFTNSSLFLLQAIFPVLDTPTPAEGLLPATFRLFQMTSITITSYGFGKGAVIILLSTFNKDIFSLKTTGLESSDSVFGFREMPGEGTEARLPIRSENNNSF
jgi:hypothetical protein